MIENRKRDAVLADELKRSRAVVRAAENARRSSTAAFARGRVHALLAFSQGRDNPESACKRLNHELRNSSGISRHYMLGEYDAALVARNLRRRSSAQARRHEMLQRVFGKAR